MAAKGSPKQVNIRIAKKVISGLGDQFSTRDVSEDQRMLDAHPSLRLHSHYHAFVGTALSVNRGTLGINNEEGRSGARGAVWVKV